MPRRKIIQKKAKALELKRIHNLLKSSPIRFRESCIEMCGWSEATFYRKIIMGNISPPEHEAIKEILKNIVKHLHNVIKKYENGQEDQQVSDL